MSIGVRPIAGWFLRQLAPVEVCGMAKRICLWGDNPAICYWAGLKVLSHASVCMNIGDEMKPKAPP